MKIPRYFAEIVEEIKTRSQAGDQRAVYYQDALSEYIFSAVLFGLQIGLVYGAIVLNPINFLLTSPLPTIIYGILCPAIFICTSLRHHQLLKHCSPGLRRSFLLAALGTAIVFCVGVTILVRKIGPGEPDIFMGLAGNGLTVWLSLTSAKSATFSAINALGNGDFINPFYQTFL